MLTAIIDKNVYEYVDRNNARGRPHIYIYILTDNVVMNKEAGLSLTLPSHASVNIWQGFAVLYSSLFKGPVLNQDTVYLWNDKRQ